MNLLVISDLHIGNNDYFETFGWKAKDFMDAIERIRYEHGVNKVILNGDIFELYKYSFREIYEKNHKLVNYLLNQKDFIFLKGNHDAICPHGEERFVMENTEGQKIYVEHGHSADFMNGTRLGRRMQTWGFNLLRWGSKAKWILGIYQRILEIEESINKIPKRYDSIRYLTHAMRLLKQYDVVILGHTHKIESHKTYYLSNKKLYINSGSCSLGRFEAVLINTVTLKYETLKFKNYRELLKEYNKSKIKEYSLIA